MASFYYSIDVIEVHAGQQRVVFSETQSAGFWG